MASLLAISEFSEFHFVYAWTAWGESLLSFPRFNLADNGDVVEWVEQQRAANETKMNNLMKTLTEKLSQDTMEYLYLKPQVHIVKGKVHRVIQGLVQETEVDLVVIGTGGTYRYPGPDHGKYRRKHLKYHWMFGAGRQTPRVCHTGDIAKINR